MADDRTPLASTGFTGAPRALWPALALAGALLLVAGVAFAGGTAGWPNRVAAFAAGVAATAAVFYVRLLAPLAEMTTACLSVKSEDLSLTVPERGTRNLRTLARVINGMAADFQEVLLLFAHMARSARQWVPLLERSVAGSNATDAERRMVAATVGQIDQIQEIISAFKFFRVTLEGDAIIDRGVNPSRVPAGAGRREDGSGQSHEGDRG